MPFTYLATQEYLGQFNNPLLNMSLLLLLLLLLKLNLTLILKLILISTKFKFLLANWHILSID
jgi:hypothetical protein